MHDRLVWQDRPLSGALADLPETTVVTERIHGSGVPDSVLTLPFRGSRLAGDDLRRQLDTWAVQGVVEPSLTAAIGSLLDERTPLDLSGWTVVVLGAGSEMGPLRTLLRWGATVAALDLPRPDLWRRILDSAAGLPGTLLVPVRPGPGPVAERAGIDLIEDLPTAAAWVAGLSGKLVIGNYVYADGASNVRVSAAVDASRRPSGPDGRSTRWRWLSSPPPPTSSPSPERQWPPRCRTTRSGARPSCFASRCAR